MKSRMKRESISWGGGSNREEGRQPWERHQSQRGNLGNAEKKPAQIITSQKRKNDITKGENTSKGGEADEGRKVLNKGKKKRRRRKKEERISWGHHSS